MKLDIGGSETVNTDALNLWRALNDPAVLTRCIPGCKAMREVSPDAYKVAMQLKVAAVGGTFEGDIALADKVPPSVCRISISGAGTLGHGNGEATFEITTESADACILAYRGTGEIGGLVVGVGQRILGGVSKHLIRRFFTALRQEFDVAGGREAKPLDAAE